MVRVRVKVRDRDAVRVVVAFTVWTEVMVTNGKSSGGEQLAFL
jgi:hypothetical protein